MTYQPFGHAATRADRHEASIARRISLTLSGKSALPSAIVEALIGPAHAVEAEVYMRSVGAQGVVKANSPIEVEDRIGQCDGSDIDICFPCSRSLLVSYVRAAQKYGVVISMSVRFLDDSVPPDGPLYQRALAIMREDPHLPWLGCVAQVAIEATAWDAACDAISQAKSAGSQ